MGLNGATLAGHRVTHARANIPAWGCWYADASIDGEHTLTGQVDLKIADLTLRGTVLSGGPAKGRSDYRIVAGAGGWGRTLPKRSYANDAGVKGATVLVDAAQAAGENLDATTIPTSIERVGPAWVRPEGPASRALELLSPSAWYVREDGVTRLGKRASGAILASVPRVSAVDRARGTLTLAPESIATILPGLVVDGLEAVDVQHDISAKEGLRSTIWGKSSSGTSRRLAAFRSIVEEMFPDIQFRGVTEYRVVTAEGKRLNLQPVRVSTGMPDLRRVMVRPGVPGCEASHALGSRVLVGFVDADPARPAVLAFEDAEGEGFVPTVLKLAGGSDFVALASKVDTLFAAIAGTVIVPGDGGAAIKTALVNALITTPTVAATKVKAT